MSSHEIVVLSEDFACEREAKPQSKDPYRYARSCGPKGISASEITTEQIGRHVYFFNARAAISFR
jgi:hypothetical protein